MNPSEIIPASQHSEVTTIPAYGANLEALRVALKANLGVGGMSLFQLPQIKLPGSGGTHFTISDMDGEKEAKTVQGIVLAIRRTRAYWPKALSPGRNEPPQCHSNDAIVGVGNPGGRCESCPLSQFGTAVRNGEPTRGQACREMKPIFILRSGAASLLPECLTLPPTSLAGWANFFSQATMQIYEGQPALIHRFIVEFGLKKKDGAPNSVVTFRRLAVLGGPEYDRIDAIRNLYAEYLEAPEAKTMEDASAYYDNPNPPSGSGQADDDQPF